jgi:hypothetical protein
MPSRFLVGGTKLGTSCCPESLYKALIQLGGNLTCGFTVVSDRQREQQVKLEIDYQLGGNSPIDRL